MLARYGRAGIGCIVFVRYSKTVIDGRGGMGSY